MNTAVETPIKRGRGRPPKALQPPPQFQGPRFQLSSDEDIAEQQIFDIYNRKFGIRLDPHVRRRYLEALAVEGSYKYISWAKATPDTP